MLSSLDSTRLAIFWIIVDGTDISQLSEFIVSGSLTSANSFQAWGTKGERMYLRWTQILISIKKYIYILFASVLLVAAAIRIGDSAGLPVWVFWVMGLCFLALAINLALLQTGLNGGRSWSRILAITSGILSLPSIFFPLAVASLLELFAPSTVNSFKAQDHRARSWLDASILSTQRRAIIVFIAIVTLLSLASVLSPRQNSNQTELSIRASAIGR